MSEPIISVSGLRGIIGENLDSQLAIRYTVAFAAQLSEPGPIVITRDGRTTGWMLAQAISSGLMGIGRDVLYGDVAATPTTGVLVRETQAAAGIQISASHNPPQYNGIKLFNSSGRVIDADAGTAVIEAYRNGLNPIVPHDQIGSYQAISDTTSAHLAAVLKTVDVDRIRQRQFKVVLDSHHGAGSVLGRRLLTELNCEFTILGDEPDGRFERSPEPTEENLKQTTEQAVKWQSDVVFCQDPDADRLAIIDQNGRYIGEEYTLAILLKHALQNRPGPVVINCSSSRMSADICQEFDCPIFYSAVGEANVTGLMIAENAVYGGEGNGGPIDPRVGYVRDSFVGMAQVLDAMAKENLTVSQLADRLPRYEIFKSKIDLPRERIPALFAALKQRYPQASVNQQDGLRLDWPDRWLLVRPSNTEPIVRAFAESKDLALSQKMCQDVAELV